MRKCHPYATLLLTRIFTRLVHAGRVHRKHHPRSVITIHTYVRVVLSLVQCSTCNFPFHVFVYVVLRILSHTKER